METPGWFTAGRRSEGNWSPAQGGDATGLSDDCGSSNHGERFFGISRRAEEEGNMYEGTSNLVYMEEIDISINMERSGRWMTENLLASIDFVKVGLMGSDAQGEEMCPAMESHDLLTKLAFFFFQGKLSKI
jgi:hypothetical protein